MGEAGLHRQLVGLQGCVPPTMAAKEATFGGWRRVAIPPSPQVPAYTTPSFLLEVSDQGGTWGHMPACASRQGRLTSRREGPCTDSCGHSWNLSEGSIPWCTFHQLEAEGEVSWVNEEWRWASRCPVGHAFRLFGLDLGGQPSPYTPSL